MCLFKGINFYENTIKNMPFRGLKVRVMLNLFQHLETLKRVQGDRNAEWVMLMKEASVLVKSY